MNNYQPFIATISVCFFILSASTALSQDSLAVSPEEELVSHRVFANIFVSHFYSFSDNVKPNAAFEMPTALLGYSASFSNRLKTTLIYDVTRTTSNQALDSEGNPINLTFFEGSKYTAFLKMAEILYSVNQFIDFRIGQLLNIQYLTTQDKFWGYRYIYFTFQEVHRYGNPADFGAQVDIKLGSKLITQLSVTNGDGPFRHQDTDGKFLFTNNIEVRPIEGLILKLYADFAPAPSADGTEKDKMAISVFAGYKTNKYRVAVEYSKVKNYGFALNSEYYGISSFTSYSVNESFDILARYDYINKSKPLNDLYGLGKGNFILLGLQYKPHNNFFCSLNFRSLNPSKKQWIYSSFGVNF